jgi:hypothetical protein
LRGAGRWHGLALLQMNGGHPREALQTWQVGCQTLICIFVCYVPCRRCCN